MEPARQEIVRECLHCADSKGGALVPRPLAELRHGAIVGEVLIDYFHLRDAEGDDAVSEETDLVYVLLKVEDVSGHVCLEPMQYFTAAATARALI